MTSSESGSESVREEIETQVRAATAEFRRQLQALQAQVADLQRRERARAGQEPGHGADVAGQACQKGSELVDGLSRGPEEEEEEEEVQEMEDLPETLFSYCMAQLAINPESIAEPVAYLVLQISIQLGLAMSFVSATVGEFFDLHWNGLEMTPKLCLYHENVINHHPYQDIFAAICCFCLAAVSMMADDKELLSCIYPNRSHSLRVRAVATIAWCFQGFVVPLTLLASIPVLMANSMTAVDVVMNGLAVLFILDVDDMLYVLVPSSSRDRLKGQLLTQSSACRWARLDPANVEVEAFIMGAYKFVYLVISYLTYVVYMLPATGPALAALWFSEDDVVHRALENIFTYCMLPCISTFAWHKPVDARDAMTTIGRAAFTTVFGVILPFCVVLFLHSWFLGTPGLSESSKIIECYNTTYDESGPSGGIVI